MICKKNSKNIVKNHKVFLKSHIYYKHLKSKENLEMKIEIDRAYVEYKEDFEEAEEFEFPEDDEELEEVLDSLEIEELEKVLTFLEVGFFRS